MAEEERSSTENVTIVAENFSGRAPTATVSSLKSEDSTEQLICKTPQKNVKKKNDVKKQSVSSKSVEAGSDEGSGRRKLVVFLGLAQTVLGALLVGAGAMAVVKGAALSRVGAGLWAGCVAVVAGVVGVLAGINDCYGLNGDRGYRGGSSPLLTAFLALSLLCLACGNSAAVLAATGLQRDAARAPTPLHMHTFQDEMEAWTPVLTNIALLIIASVHCVVCVISIYHVSKRVCPCFRAKQPFDHNQFDPGYKAGQPFVIHIDEKGQDAEKIRNHELCKELEVKLQGETLKKKKESAELPTTVATGGEFGSANSKEKLVTHWLGRHQSVLPTTGGAASGAAGGAAPARTRRGPAAGVRKQRKPPHAPMVLLPAHHATTLGRVPMSVLVPPRYATLPLPPGHYAPPPHHAHGPPPVYYPLHDARVRRRKSPRSPRQERRRGGGRAARERDSQLTRSLERIHRKRRTERERMTEADLKRTYTGLDRAYAEQFIAVCDESRHATEHHDSLGSSTGSDTTHSHHIP